MENGGQIFPAENTPPLRSLRSLRSFAAVQFRNSVSVAGCVQLEFCLRVVSQFLRSRREVIRIITAFSLLECLLPSVAGRPKVSPSDRRWPRPTAFRPG